MMVSITQNINETIFRKNDIRGRVPEDLNFDSVSRIGQAFAEYIAEQTPEKNPSEMWISIGYDARLHSPELSKALITGITSYGMNVVDLGRCPTPLVYYSAFYTSDRMPQPDGTIMITGSHNPPNYNGLKMGCGKNCLKSDDIMEIKNICLESSIKESNSQGNVVQFDIITPYIEYLSKEFAGIIDKKQPVKVVVDSGNGCGGEVAPQILKNMGCEVIELYSDPDGTFPNHHPDPTIPKNLEELIDRVASENADLGIAYDGDVDRIGVVDNQGNIIPGDMLMIMFGMDIIEEQKYENPTFISEVKCSQVMYDELNKAGGNAIMWKTGHSFIKDKMKQEKALLAGEMSGHIFFADRFFGFDDAIYASCRLVELIAKNKQNDSDYSISGYLAQYPQMHATPEIRKPCADDIKFHVIEKLKAKLSAIRPSRTDIKDVITIDGIRIVFNDGFGLVRASNTEPILVLRFEAASEENMLKNQAFIESLILEVM